MTYDLFDSMAIEVELGKSIRYWNRLKEIIMKFLRNLNVLRYYKMSNEDLEAESQRYGMGSYFDGNIIRREKIVEQLILKDNAIMFRYTLLSTLITLIIVIISLLMRLVAVFS